MPTGKFSKTRAIALELEKKKEEKALLFVEGARLPWPGVILIVLAMALISFGALALVYQLPYARPDMNWWAGGLSSMLVGFGLTFFTFGRWADL
jgi:hypothetical protein